VQPLVESITTLTVARLKRAEEARGSVIRIRRPRASAALSCALATSTMHSLPVPQKVASMRANHAGELRIVSDGERSTVRRRSRRRRSAAPPSDPAAPGPRKMSQPGDRRGNYALLIGPGYCATSASAVSSTTPSTVACATSIRSNGSLCRGGRFRTATAWSPAIASSPYPFSRRPRRSTRASTRKSGDRMGFVSGARGSPS
jgi:hypothetical protein